MLKRFAGQAISVLAVLAFSFSMLAQMVPAQQPPPAKTRKAAPAPRRDLSGIWETPDRMEGISPAGVKMHAPFTPLELASPP